MTTYRCIVFTALLPSIINRDNFEGATFIREAESPEAAVLVAASWLLNPNSYPYYPFTWQPSSGIVFINNHAIGTVFLVPPGL